MSGNIFTLTNPHYCKLQISIAFGYHTIIISRYYKFPRTSFPLLFLDYNISFHVQAFHCYHYYGPLRISFQGFFLPAKIVQLFLWEKACKVVI